MTDRFEQQLSFLKEIESLKTIFRRTRILDNSRYENDAEHAWQLGVMAMVLEEYANESINCAKVVKMVLIHDIVEIDAGDTFLYDDAMKATQAEREKQAAERIFGLLPSDMRDEFHELWHEFDAKESQEAKFAGALDRLQPLLHNYYTKGYSWKEHGVKRHQVEEVNKVIALGSESLWAFAKKLIGESVEKGYLQE